MSMRRNLIICAMLAGIAVMLNIATTFFTTNLISIGAGSTPVETVDADLLMALHASVAHFACSPRFPCRAIAYVTGFYLRPGIPEGVGLVLGIITPFLFLSLSAAFAASAARGRLRIAIASLLLVLGMLASIPVVTFLYFVFKFGGPIGLAPGIEAVFAIVFILAVETLAGATWLGLRAFKERSL